MAKSILERTRAAILKVMGPHMDDKAVETIRNATYTGKNDPGGWSPTAAVIIHTESQRGEIPVPNGAYGEYGVTLEDWFKVSDLLGDHFCEHINGAVIGVYKN